MTTLSPPRGVSYELAADPDIAGRGGLSNVDISFTADYSEAHLLPGE